MRSRHVSLRQPVPGDVTQATSAAITADTGLSAVSALATWATEGVVSRPGVYTRDRNGWVGRQLSARPRVSPTVLGGGGMGPSPPRLLTTPVTVHLRPQPSWGCPDAECGWHHVFPGETSAQVIGPFVSVGDCSDHHRATELLTGLDTGPCQVCDGRVFPSVGWAVCSCWTGCPQPGAVTAMLTVSLPRDCGHVGGPCNHSLTQISSGVPCSA